MQHMHFLLSVPAALLERGHALLERRHEPSRRAGEPGSLDVCTIVTGEPIRVDGARLGQLLKGAIMFMAPRWAAAI
jgi:hypothetical protein